MRLYISHVASSADQRLAGLTSIDDKLDLGSGLTIKALRDAAGRLDQLVATHNQAMADANATRADVKNEEKKVAELFARALAAVAGKFGRDSREYKQAGGVRRSDRKRPHRPSRAGAGNGAAPPPAPAGNGHADGA